MQTLDLRCKSEISTLWSWAKKMGALTGDEVIGWGKRAADRVDARLVRVVSNFSFHPSLTKTEEDWVIFPTPAQNWGSGNDLE